MLLAQRLEVRYILVAFPPRTDNFLNVYPLYQHVFACSGDLAIRNYKHIYSTYL